MTTAAQLPSEYRNLPVINLVESPSNPRRTFDDSALAELAESIRAQGVLSPLLVRPTGHQSFEIVAGARRFRAARMAGLECVPARIVELNDSQALEASIVENLQRRDVHPLDEANGFAALMRFDEPKYSIEQIAAKCGKSPAYVAARLRLTELAPIVVEAFAKDEIGVGHALLLAKLQPDQQAEALNACWQESYVGGKPKRILLPVRHLQQWIEHNILLELANAPFSREDAQLLPEAGSCVDCPKRTGHNVLLFEGLGTHPDSCTDPKCWANKVESHVRLTIASKPKLVQISTAYGTAKGGTAAIPRNKYVEIRQDKPQRKEQRDWPEYKACKYTAEAIVTEGSEKGELRRVCANPECPVHHPNRQAHRAQPDAAIKAEQEKCRHEDAVAQTIGLRVLKAIGDAVPVRLMRRDLLLIASRLGEMLDDRKLSLLARQHGIGKAKDSKASNKLFTAFLQKVEESKLSRIVVEMVILLSVQTKNDAGRILREAAEIYKVDTDAITTRVRQDLASREKARKGTGNTPDHVNSGKGKGVRPQRKAA